MNLIELFEIEKEAARGEGLGNGGERQFDGGAKYCVCNDCGHKQLSRRGIRCVDETCENCGGHNMHGV